MAEPELKKLNKNVEEAVNILKMYVGNSAQARNFSDKQKEAISRWFDVLDKEEEQVKRQRAFTERERDASGRFKKKFEFSLINMADTVTGMFMSVAKGIASSITKVAAGITSHLGNLFSAVKSHFLGLFGEESEWFDILRGLWESTKGFFGWFVRGFLFIFKKTPKWATKIIDILGGMFELQIKQIKMEYLHPGGRKEKKGGLIAALGFALFAAAAIFAGWLKARLIILNKLWASFKITRLFKWIKVKYLAFADKFKKFFGFFSKITTALSKWPIIGRLLRGLKFGLKFLGWPLTIILGIIDFIKGWRSATGDWQSKLKNGFTSVIHGLIDLPLELLGWALDWVMKKLGLGDWIPEGGIGNKLKQWATDIMDWLLTWGPIGILLDVIKGLTSGGFMNVFKPKIEKMTELIGKLFDIISGVWNSFIEWITDKAKSLPFGIGNSVSKWIENLKAEDNKPPVGPSNNLPEKLGLMERRKREEQNQNAKNIKDSVDKQTEATKQSQAKTDGAINAVMGINQSGGGNSVEQRQIPDEIDNLMLAVKDNSMDFD